VPIREEEKTASCALPKEGRGRISYLDAATREGSGRGGIGGKGRGKESHRKKKNRGEEKGKRPVPSSDFGERSL